MGLTRCFLSAARNWYLLVLCALVAAGGTFYLLHHEKPRYRSSLRLAIGPSPEITRQTLLADIVNALNKPTLIATFAELVGAHKNFAVAASDLGLPPSIASRYSESTVVLPQTNVIALSVEGPRRSTAEALAAAIGSKAIASIEGFYKNFSVRQIDQPSTPSDPVSPRPKRDVPLAGAGGLCVGFFLGLFRDYVRERRRAHPRELDSDPW